MYKHLTLKNAKFAVLNTLKIKIKNTGNLFLHSLLVSP